MNRFVLDASAVLTLLQKEPDESRARQATVLTSDRIWKKMPGKPEVEAIR